VQRFSLVPAPSVLLIVVDNSPEGDATTCQSRQGAWPLHYVHEVRPGISHARNTAVEAVPAGTDFIAMIDDDEVPAPTWLDCLLDARMRSGADIVAGPAIPVFPPHTPAWVAAGGFFLKPTNMHALRDLDPHPPVATCNVLLRAGLLGETGVRFDPALALSGGEDKLVFQTLKLRGCRFAWAAEAKVAEWVPAERATLGYMWRESFRRGAVKFYVKRQLKSESALRSVRIALRMTLRCIAGIAWQLLCLLANLWRGRRGWVPHALDIADNLGTLAGIMGVRNRHYRPEVNA
jgi:glycosyltransferase involved in cell wall biosynthesis